MPGFDPSEARDAIGRWTKAIGSAITNAASDAVKNLMQKAKEAEPEVEEVGKKIADALNGRFTGINLKSEERIREKAKKEYGGDVSKIKDSVRTTIVVDYDKLPSVVDTIRPIPGIDRIKIQDGAEFFGYKGILVNYKTTNGIDAEIQVNSPGMLYAKEAKKDGTHFLTDSQYADIQKRTGLNGGLGHEYYEKIRSYRKNGRVPTDSEQIEIGNLIKKSEEYYSHFYGF